MKKNYLALAVVALLVAGCDQPRTQYVQSAPTQYVDQAPQYAQPAPQYVQQQPVVVQQPSGNHDMLLGAMAGYMVAGALHGGNGGGGHDYGGHTIIQQKTIVVNHYHAPAVVRPAPSFRRR